MKFIAILFVLLAAMFYFAGHGELGRYSRTICQYGDTFCDHPYYLLVVALLAGVWAMFVSVE